MTLNRMDISEIKGPVYIAPAGSVGLVTYHALRRRGIEVAGFCDNDARLSGKEYCGCPIIPPDTAVSQNPDAVYIITTVYFRVELTEQLRALGASNILYAGQFMSKDVFNAALDELDEAVAARITRKGDPKAAASGDAQFFWILEPRLDIDAVYLPFIASDYLEPVEAFKKWIDAITEAHEVIRHIFIAPNPDENTFGQLYDMLIYLNEHLKTPVKYVALEFEHSNINEILARKCELYLNENGIPTKRVNRAEFDRLNVEGFRTCDSPIAVYLDSAYSIEEDKYNCVYTHIAKNAGTSICRMLSSSDMHQKRALHLKLYDSAKFERYFKFSVIRNPWDRLVSLYSYYGQLAKKYSWAAVDKNLINTNAIYYYKTFRDYVLNLKNIKADIQADWMCDDDGKILVDYIGRFENLPETVEYIRDKLGLGPDFQLIHVNASKHKPYTEYYDDEMKEIVREVFKRDIELFGYEFGKHPGANIIVNPREDFVPVGQKG